MEQNINISVRNLHLHYGVNHALKDVSLDIRPNAVTAFIGPSGCGKSTLLKTLNRMNDLVDNVKIEGKVLLDGEDIYAPEVDTTVLRKRIGMVFQQPNPFPMSIYDNIAYGPRVHGIKDKKKLDQIVEESLKGAAIFDEVKDRLKGPPWVFPEGSSRGSVSPELWQYIPMDSLWTNQLPPWTQFHQLR